MLSHRRHERRHAGGGGGLNLRPRHLGSVSLAQRSPPQPPRACPQWPPPPPPPRPTTRPQPTPPLARRWQHTPRAPLEATTAPWACWPSGSRPSPRTGCVEGRRQRRRRVVSRDSSAPGLPVPCHAPARAQTPYHRLWLPQIKLNPATANPAVRRAGGCAGAAAAAAACLLPVSGARASQRAWFAGLPNQTHSACALPVAGKCCSEGSTAPSSRRGPPPAAAAPACGHLPPTFH